MWQYSESLKRKPGIKTTTIEILEGFRAHSAGRVAVLGADPYHAGEWWRARVGIVLQTWHDKKNSWLPGGQRRRLDVGIGIAGRPFHELVHQTAVREFTGAAR